MENVQHNPLNGVIYTNSNHDALTIAQSARGYVDPEWATLRLWNEYGFTVRKGEHGVSLKRVVKGTKTKKEKDGKETEKGAWGIKFFTVFNRAQVVKRAEPWCRECRGTLGDNPTTIEGKPVCNTCYTRHALNA